MATKEHKVVRRANAMSELARLSGLLADNLDIEVPDVQVTNRDSELAEIQRVENVNELLSKVLEAKAKPATETVKQPSTKPVKHGTKQ